ncbi:ABC transporter permease [Dactylosporangium cerinum]|uniref:ABC transporter permease n=1 Tax=Dactylosporangium cerinum TaxID=1434730 RepID=A0ABV9W9T8_9ACTN
MIWLTWRQFRTQAVAVCGGLAALAVVLAITGPKLAHDYAAGISSCGDRDGCRSFTDQFYNDHVPPYFGVVAIVMVVPAIIGLFWGAPLITREIEAGTHQLVWNQTVTRTRWLAVKLGVTGLVAIAAAGLGSLAVTWWSAPIDQAAAGEFPRLSPLMFDARGIAPMAYAAFAFALGVAAGSLIRRTLPAIAVTLAAFAIAQVVMPLWVRPNLITPVQVDTAITAANLDGVKLGNGGTVRGMEVAIDRPGAWIIANETVRAGRVVDSLPAMAADCMPQAPERADPADRQACFTGLADLGYRQRVAYQPADRFWALQLYETAIFAGLTVLLAGVSFWRVRRLS